MANTIAMQDLEGRIRAKFGGGVKRSRAKRGLELRICCPFCVSSGNTRDTGYKLWINPAMGVYRCWRCEKKGSVSQLLGAAFKPVGKLEAARSSVRELETCDSSPGELARLDHLDKDHVAARYMLHRGFDHAALGKYYGVSYCGAGRPFGGRSFRFDTTNTIVFPIWMGGKLAGWQCRLMYNPDELDDETCEAFGFVWDDEKAKFLRPPKYFTSPGLTKGAVLYNYDMARKSELVVVVEGPTDVLAAGPCAVGTLGKGVASTQVDLLTSQWKVVVVLLDPDAAATASQLHADIMAVKPSTVLVTLAGYDDPGSAPTKEIWKQVAASLDKKGIDIAKLNLGPYWCDEILRK